MVEGEVLRSMLREVMGGYMEHCGLMCLEWLLSGKAMRVCVGYGKRLMRWDIPVCRLDVYCIPTMPV